MNTQAPFTFNRGLAAKNRTVLAPMTNSQSHEDGTLGDEELRWLARHVDGGYGTIITCASHVRKDAKAWKGQLGCFSDEHIAGLREIANMARRQNALSILQIFHGGLRSTSKTTGQQPVAPSVVHLTFPGFEVPRALEDKEIEQIIQDFKAAAIRAHKAGMSGIEVHGANGYLFTQFISKETNLRTDKWGGSLENRARFLLRVVEEIRAALPAPFIVGVRLLPEDTPKARGFDIDEVEQILRWLDERNVDYVHLSGKDVRANPWKYAEGSRNIVERFRANLSNRVSLIACGGIKTQADTQVAFSHGADFVATATAAIAQPDWPREVEKPDFKPPTLPMKAAELKARAVSDGFINYLKGMKMVQD